jgi:hypothetical protein
MKKEKKSVFFLCIRYFCTQFFHWSTATALSRALAGCATLWPSHGCSGQLQPPTPCSGQASAGYALAAPWPWLNRRWPHQAAPRPRPVATWPRLGLRPQKFFLKKVVKPRVRTWDSGNPTNYPKPLCHK